MITYAHFRVALCCGALLASAATGFAQDWTRFRGPNGTGASEATTVPTVWTEKDFNWRVEIPGEGHSQPVIWGDRIFLTSATNGGQSRTIMCRNRLTGAEEWSKSYPLSTHNKHTLNSYASSTPTVDDERVYFVLSDPDHYILTALTHEGKEAWQYDLGPYKSQHGDGASPIVFENLVILGNEQDGPSFLLAVDRKTGKRVWQSPRREKVVSYSTPCIYEPKGGAPELIFNSQSHGISAVDARTGAALWEAPLFDKRTCSSPVIAGGHIFGTCGSGGGGNYLLAVRPGGSGDVSQTSLGYKLDKQIPYVPTPIAYDGLLFLWSEKGIVTCVDAATGASLWTQRVGGEYWGSPIRVQDRIYITDVKAGECIVIRAGKQFEILARNPTLEGTHSTPAVSHGTLYLRTFSHLISVGGEKAAK